jgi:hypothetical protein
MADHGSEVFPVQDTVAFLEHFQPLGSQVELFPQIAHVEQLFVVLLKQPASHTMYVGLM